MALPVVRKPRILIVDDDASLRRSVVRALHRTYEIAEAADGLEAIALLSGDGVTFDAIVTDVDMPVLGGDGLVVWLEQHLPALVSHTIVLTGGRDGPRRTWIHAFERSQGCVLDKPCPLEVLRAAIERVVAIP